jgi:excisionase family DNA binding protein
MAAAPARLAAWSIGRAPHPGTLRPRRGIERPRVPGATSYLAHRNPSIAVIARQIPSAGDAPAIAGENPERPTTRGHMTDKLLTQQQLADELEVSLRTLERWRQQGTGPAFIRVGRSPRYRRADIDAWLERQRQTREW